jgi:CRISPR-associated protein Cas4
MILGMLRHKVFDIFNKNEQILVSSIKENLSEQEIHNLYEALLAGIAQETISLNSQLIYKFNIDAKDFLKSLHETTTPEIKLRVESIKKTLNQGFLGKELWRNLSPKYLTEFKIESLELGLRGRVDRIKFSEEIVPYETKSRKQIYESDKIQLAGYALLLEKEFNKKIEKGVIEIMGNTEEVILNEELKSKVLEIAEQIRNLKEENASMPSNFKKCQKCSLKDECA